MTDALPLLLIPGASARLLACQEPVAHTVGPAGLHQAGLHQAGRDSADMRGGARPGLQVVGALDDALTGQPKVGQLQVPILGHQQVVRLEVPVDDALHSAAAGRLPAADNDSPAACMPACKVVLCSMRARSFIAKS